MWVVARVKGIGMRSEHRAATDMRRHGVECFWPEQRRYFIDRRTKQEKFRSACLMPGYLFIRLHRPVDRDLASASYFLSYLLGSWTGERFLPREIPGSYVTALIEHGPFDVNRVNSRAPFKKGQKVKFALSHITAIIREIEALDADGRPMIRTGFLGVEKLTAVDPSRLEAAE